MDELSRSKREETREFWEAAIRLWAESGVSVREFCSREGLTEHTFYSWRRELLPGSPPLEANHESSVTDGGEVAADGRRRRKRKQVAAGEMPEAAAATPFIELMVPTSAGLCRCTLELENTGGAKMRIQLRSVATPDLAAISRSFWNHPS